MNQQAIAIIIAGALIAAAIALTNHWALVQTGDPGSSLLVRLNRWTGVVVICGGSVQPGWEMPCPVAVGPVPAPSSGPAPPPPPVLPPPR